MTQIGTSRSELRCVLLCFSVARVFRCSAVARAAVVIMVGAAGLVASVNAQKPTPTPLLDGRGLPLPFGVPPYFKPDYPLGSGQYKAIMAVEPGLSAHIAYYPADLNALGTKKLPVVIWGNGSCLYAGNRYRSFLTELASHGYLVIAGGPMGAVELEVGPQSNPAPRQGGPGRGARGEQPPAGAGGRADLPAAAAAAAQPQGRVTVPLLKEAVDWVIQQNSAADSRFKDRLDLHWIVSMGHSCGGGLAVQLATEDSRINGLGIWFSGAGLAGARGSEPDSLKKIKGPVLLVTGEASLDIAYQSGKSTFEALNHLPIFYGWQDGLQHIGTFGARNGGDLGVLATNWLEWTTRNDQKAARMFKGSGCTLCKDPTWHVQKKKID
jgi:dienelactone hydrolase